MTNEGMGLLADLVTLSRPAGWVGIPAFLATPTGQEALDFLVKATVEIPPGETSEVALLFAPAILAMIWHIGTDIADGFIAKVLAGRTDQSGHGANLDTIADLTGVPGFIAALAASPEVVNWLNTQAPEALRDINAFARQAILASIMMIIWFALTAFNYRND